MRIAVVAPDAEDIDKHELACHGLTRIHTIPQEYDPSNDETNFEGTLDLIQKWFETA